ncbi:MAG: DUF4386 domain-containing protein [Cytophagaceae bacterium]|nr:DUF4386 domain-containing protein [Cytophagaceae bacterium]
MKHSHLQLPYKQLGKDIQNDSAMIFHKNIQSLTVPDMKKELDKNSPFTDSTHFEESFNPSNSKRTWAKITGISLLLMAVLAGIAIPALGSKLASIGLVGIFILDILVSIGIYRFHRTEKPDLAGGVSLLRVLYTAIFGMGIFHHLQGDVAAFSYYWGIGLIVFGLHLLMLGLLYSNKGGNKWVHICIKALLLLAGIGYLIQYIGQWLVPNPLVFTSMVNSIFLFPMIVSELSYACWLLWKGIKRKKSNS